MAAFTSIASGQGAAAISTVEKVESTPSSIHERPLSMRIVMWLLRRKDEPKGLAKYEPVPRFDLSRKSESLSSGKTVLYLAYGSNLCASTFQGQRGIRPISALNVSVPDLELTFDLPGIAYSEPRFANTRLRSQESARLLNDSNSDVRERELLLSENASSSSTTTNATGTASSLGWTKGLVGVVYEITPSELEHIFVTEGGGSSYAVIEVPCYPLEQGAPAPSPLDRPDGQDGGQAQTQSLTAYTLLAKDRPSSRMRRSPGQPSRRYLELLRTGAREHGLPEAYQAWLAGLEAYRVGSLAQRVGQSLFFFTWMPWLMGSMLLNGFTARKGGVPAPWSRALMEGLFGAMWVSYDYGFRWVFGEGERAGA